MPNCYLSADATCFDKSTQITLVDNSTKSIDKMEVGDIIMAYDTLTHKLDTAVVMGLHKHDVPNIKLVQMTFNENIDLKINCTKNHPFRTAKNEWVEARDLMVGDTLYILNALGTEMKEVTIKSMDESEPVRQVFNISTSNKNYFANGVLVHNK